MASDGEIQSFCLNQPGEINQILEEIHRRVATDKTLKKSINFTVKPKTSDSTDWHKVYEYIGPDKDTVNLLQRYSQIWQQDPGQFLAVGTQAYHYPHPVSYVAGKCLQLDSNEAWMAILRRCTCRVLSCLQQKYNLPAEQIAQHLEASPWAGSYSREELIEKIKQLTDVGSRYELLEKDLGVGAGFVLGCQLPRELWERRIPKSGETRRKAIDHLQSAGIAGIAAPYQCVSQTVIAFMIKDAEFVANNYALMAQTELWQGGVSIHHCSSTDSDSLSFTPF